MKKIVVAVSLVYLVTVVAGYPTEVPESEKCVPNTTFLHDDGCNSCFCRSSGLKKLAGCTRMSCAPLHAGTRKHRSVDEVSTDTCHPGSSFLHSDNCNTCVCPESGVKSQAGCTEKLCLNVTHQGHTHHSSESSESSEHRTTRDTSETCEPGTSFMHSDNCNHCFCPASGLKSQAGCTLKFCYNSTLPVTVQHSSESSDDSSDQLTKRDASGESSDETCSDGDKWIAADGCNQCWCPPSRKTAEAACTKMACVPPHLLPSKEY